jgi:hypothetical protein
LGVGVIIKHAGGQPGEGRGFRWLAAREAKGGCL